MVKEATRGGGPRGRGGREERRRAIVGAATEVFLEKGYAGASVDDVIARAGGSKRTVYGYFSGKAGLFSAVVTENAECTLVPLGEAEFGVLGPREALLAFGRRYLGTLMEPTALGLYRVVVGEGARFPALAAAFFGAGPGRASSVLAGLLKRLEEAGDLLGVGDPDATAGTLCGALRGDLHLRVVLGLRGPPDEEEMEEAVRRAVGPFLGSCAPSRERP